MSGFIINVDFSLHEASKKQSDGNQKHQRFVRRRRFLERKGFLKKKQLPAPQQQPQPAPKGHVSHQGQPRKKRPAEAGTDHDSFHASGFSHAPRTLPKGKDGCRVVQVGRAMDSSSQLTCFPSKVRKVAGSIKSLAGVHREALLSEYDSGLPAAPVSSKPSKLVAIDCEMVGTGPGGRTSDLARCSIVNYHGDVVYDKYIRPIEPIADYRTRWSGIRKHHMKNATPFKTAQKEILKLLTGKVVVGHAIHNDFKALKYFHPKVATRDTAQIPLLNRRAGFPEHETASLKRLTKQLLHRDIQVGRDGHSSVEDARATMELYKVIEAEWEKHLALSRQQE
ncbi:interferon-stimulated 20 kDa exonuclease-like 2 [Alligator mississippiensis]|uniref:interferon-stimulated 20 kDa exonuclease-like 2 n=1 Tax=Alligator mississippiensis TaxID=8496 RepID=UPI0003D0E405|nr:interferon-stimulated 20 kDa exonuclease-like 2 [Alligator mississippiensis]XP_059575131.1 interferon-stimulated 20 kDa exonuclease-like 2 [Alligator mississippiensis]XP_059575133.1 interferon-stimulated 20 kDa exonuclease-like 2 [Alligator mississippiensis]